MSGEVVRPHAADQQKSSQHREAATVALCLAAVTGIVFVPQLATDPNDFPAWLNLVWLALLLSAAPVAAFFLIRRRGCFLGASWSWMISLSQLAVTVALTRLDTWLEVRSGYLLAGSSEVAMSYGMGFVLSLVVGSVLALLVSIATGAGGQRHTESG